MGDDVVNAVKFTFNEAFDGGASKRAAEESTRIEDMKKTVRAEGEAAGFEAGRAQAIQDLEGRIAALLDEAHQQLDLLIQARTQHEQTLRKEAAQLAYHIGMTLCKKLMAQHPLAEIEALISDCFELCHDEPRIVIRVADELLDNLKARLEPMTAQAGYAGKIVLIADDAIAPGDCRVEWADGGVERHVADITTEIAERVERYIATDRAEPQPAGRLAGQQATEEENNV